MNAAKTNRGGWLKVSILSAVLLSGCNGAGEEDYRGRRNDAAIRLLCGALAQFYVDNARFPTDLAEVDSRVADSEFGYLRDSALLDSYGNKASYNLVGNKALIWFGVDGGRKKNVMWVDS